MKSRQGINNSRTEGCNALNHYLLRRAPVCATSTLFCLIVSSATASTKVFIRQGDSIDRLARKFHVSNKAIAHTNCISLKAVLKNGMTIIVPDPPAQFANTSPVKQELQRKTAYARALKLKRIQLAERNRQQQIARTSRHHSFRTASYRRHYRTEAAAPRPATDVIRTAYAYRGVPYVYGGTGGRGFDCSGFTSTIYRKKGVRLPRTAAEQFNKGRHIDSSHMKEGDLVFFHTTHSGISHVGIYAGDGKFVHASSSGGSVRVDSLESGYYKDRLRGARRVSP